MKDHLDELLAGHIEPGVYRLTQPLAIGEIAARAGRHGWRFVHLDGRKIRSKVAFLNACAEALAFPAYFGRNWDALADCLRDLSWAPTTAGYLVVYEDAGVLAAAAPADFAMALDILRTAVTDWRDTPTPLVVLFRRAGRAGALLPKL